MRNPTFFWGAIALLQIFWILSASGCYWWLKPILPKRMQLWQMAVLWLIIGNGLMYLFQFVLPDLRWRGSMSLLLFTVYTLMLSIVGWLIHLSLRHFVSRPTLNFGLRTTLPLIWLALIAAGLYGAYVPHIVHYQVKLNKPLAQPLKIALVSDTHLGRFIGARHLLALQDAIKQENPDLLILAGEIMDDDTEVYRKQHMVTQLQYLQTPLGQYAVLGNHDNYKGVQQEIVDDMQQAGFTVLRDQNTIIDNQIQLVGRRDKVEQRLSAAEVIPKSKLPVLVIDHQPADMAAISKTNADLVLSGHTHKGQIFPATLLISKFQTYPYGHYQIGHSQLIVTSGLGLWGMPFRLGTRSEIVMIELIGK